MATPERAAYQGAPGAFSEDAARVLLGPSVELVPRETLAAVFEALEAGEVAAIVVPVENSLAGAVPGCAHLIARHAVHIVAERRHRIAHALLAAPGVRIADLRAVRSHPVALAQCAQFFRSHPAVRPVAAFDTAGAVAALLACGARDEGAIASRRAADLYGAAVLQEDVQDTRDNFTRFLRLDRGAAASAPQPGQKTTLTCVLRHEPGELHAALGVLAARGLNLTRIESYPLADRPFEYGFLLDIGPAETDALREALGRFEERTQSFRLLGHYAAAE